MVDGFVETNNIVKVSVNKSFETEQNYPKIFLGLYGDAGKLIGVLQQNVEQNKIDYDFDIAKFVGVKKANVFLWKDTGSLMPAAQNSEYVISK